MENYDEFEFQQIEQRKANESVLDQFTIWLKSTGISDATVRTHVSNIDFYINEYLLHEEVNEAAFGIETVDDFLGYWFPRKAVWSSPRSVKSNCASLKKFYAFMLEIGKVSNEQLAELKRVIKVNSNIWLSCYDQQDDFHF